MNFDEEKIIHPLNGFLGLFINTIVMLLSIAVFVINIILFETLTINAALFTILLIVSILVFVGTCICFGGLRVINPNEALVLSLFGKYYGTIYDSGFYFINPFASAIYPKKVEEEGKNEVVQLSTKTNIQNLKITPRKISTKIQTFANGSQKVNDSLGNPIEVSAIIVWRVVNATKAVINIDDYKTYLSNQTDSTIRNIARLYPYDIIDDNDDNEEKTLRGSASTIASEMKEELTSRVENAGIEIIEVRLNQIAYAPEIAAAMLQRQQAVAVIAARQKIVEGAVSMVEMALERLKADDVVNLDEERKAQMVSNLLVVLCGNKEASPIVNAGSIY